MHLILFVCVVCTDIYRISNHNWTASQDVFLFWLVRTGIVSQTFRAPMELDLDLMDIAKQKRYIARVQDLAELSPTVNTYQYLAFCIHLYPTYPAYLTYLT